MDPGDRITKRIFCYGPHADGVGGLKLLFSSIGKLALASCSKFESQDLEISS